MRNPSTSTLLCPGVPAFTILIVCTGSFGPPHHARANMIRRCPTLDACVDTVATSVPSRKTLADPCVGPTVVIQANVRTLAESVALAPFAVENCTDPSRASTVVCVCQAPVYVASESGTSPSRETNEGALVNAVPT